MDFRPLFPAGGGILNDVNCAFVLTSLLLFSKDPGPSAPGRQFHLFHAACIWMSPHQRE